MARRHRKSAKRHSRQERQRAAIAAARVGDTEIARRYGVGPTTVARWRREFRVPASGSVSEQELAAALRQARARGRRRRGRRAAADSEDLRRYEQSSAELAQHWDFDIRRRVARDPNASEEALRVLSEESPYGGGPRKRHRRERSRYPQAPGLGTDVSYELEDLRWLVANNPATSLELMRQLAASEHDDVAAAVAASSNTPAAVLRPLAAHASPEVRAAAAGNAGLPEGLLGRLIHDRSPSVRRAVLRHPGCEADQIRSLARDNDGWTVRAAILHPECPSDVLADVALSAADDSHVWDLWGIIARHPNSPPEALQAVAEKAAGLLYLPERRRARRRLRKGT